MDRLLSRQHSTAAQIEGGVVMMWFGGSQEDVTGVELDDRI